MSGEDDRFRKPVVRDSNLWFVYVLFAAVCNVFDATSLMQFRRVATNRSILVPRLRWETSLSLPLTTSSILVPVFPTGWDLARSKKVLRFLASSVPGVNAIH
ncbi:hypothetical protein AVEN_91554-1 [Araneus ventricosus]|uniref:Uncharacterized protein n=1 Tax=Araneus ventricosus TaxID=182803 RepID=A0A4Y2VVI9_ARAVE|nr:hypothetical protein AVEN_91554-1 [Araneus ventricosus]